MMMSFVRFFATLIILAASVASFQGVNVAPKRSYVVKSVQNLPSPHFGLRAAPADDGAGAGESSSGVSDEVTDEVTDLDKATFEIAKEYAQTGIPEDSSSSDGFKVDGFSIGLGCYVLFVIIDTIFHITPDENYIDALDSAVKGAVGAVGAD